MPSSTIGCATAGIVRATSCSTMAGVVVARLFLSAALTGGRLRARRLEAGAEAAQIALDRLAVGADRRFELLRL